MKALLVHQNLDVPFIEADGPERGKERLHEEVLNKAHNTILQNLEDKRLKEVVDERTVIGI